jgi:hypothetical protein
MLFNSADWPALNDGPINVKNTQEARTVMC